MAISIILASASPRRRELMSHIVSEFEVAAADVDETPKKDESASNLVERLAQMKAQCIMQSLPDKVRAQNLVIGSDTVVAHPQEILGKPLDYNDFKRMMGLLSNTTHQVYTGVCVLLGSALLSQVVVSDVTMATISEDDIERYWATREPTDKAGGYAIQGIGGQFVKSIKGSFSAVVGLPLFETKTLIQEIQRADKSSERS